MPELSIEEMCRALLAKAVADGLVIFNREGFYHTEGPEDLTCGDICGMANLLASYFATEESTHA